MKKHIAPRAPRFDRQWTELINLLPDENERKLLTDAIVRYQLDATEPQLPAHLAVAFGFIRPTIDRRARARMRRRERMEKQRRAAGIANAQVAEAAPQAAIDPEQAGANDKSITKTEETVKQEPFKKTVLTPERRRELSATLLPLLDALRRNAEAREAREAAQRAAANPPK